MARLYDTPALIGRVCLTCGCDTLNPKELFCNRCREEFPVKSPRMTKKKVEEILATRAQEQGAV